MPQVIFANTAGPACLYVAQSTASDTGWAAFVLPADAPAQKETLTLAEVWALQQTSVFGAFVFAQAAPKNLTTFAANVNTYQAQSVPTPAGHTLLWLQQPDAPITTENANSLITGKNKYYNIVAQDFNAPLGNFATMSVSYNVIVGLNDDASAICFTYYNYFSIVSFAPGIRPGSSNVDFQSYLSFSGATRGCFTFGMTMQGQGVLTGYGAAFRYFYGGADGQYNELGAPIFAADNANGHPPYFTCCVDPLDAFNTGQPGGLRTYISFTTPGTDNPAPQLITNLRCDTGEVIFLTPVVSFDPVTRQPTAYSARLVLQPRTTASALMPAYFVPAGDFTMVIKGTPLVDGNNKPRPFQLLPGLSGIETISFFPQRDGYAGDTVRFTIGSPAYSPGFPFPDVSLTTGGEAPGPLLTGDWGTVAMNILSSSTIIPQFSAQPADAPLYAPKQPQVGPDPAFLGFFEPSASLSQGPTFSFAASAYGSISSVNADFQKFESQVLSPSRKATIRAAATTTSQNKQAAMGLVPVSGTDIWSTTRQGLLARIGTTGNWNELQLAQNTVAGTFFQLRFLNLMPQLQAAFQSNQLMLVASQNRYLGAFTSTPPTSNTPFFQNEMSIDQWAFQFNTGVGNTFSDKKNVLIFKFCEGTLKDRVKNPGKWEHADGFNIADLNNPLPNEITAVSQWLQDYMSDAEAQLASGNKLFENFVSIINKEDWNGILILKADLDLAQFPQEIRGMLAGMDVTRLNGHHIGIEVNRIQNGTTLTMENNSSIFGLINYLDVAYQQMLRNAGTNDVSNVPVPPPFGVDYDFKVLSLQVLFENTRIKSFKSKIQLTLNKLFADKVTQITSPVTGVSKLNSVVLNGTYQRHGDTPVYIFDQTGLNHFQLTGNVLNKVSVVKVQFNTLENQDGDTQTVRSRFTIWGYMNFNALQGMDLFSFGSTPGSVTDNNTPVGLSFSNLFVEMVFQITAPAARTFGFEADQMAFNAAACPPRPGSLYPSFALEAAGLIQPDVNAKPDSIGYLSVQAQGLSLTALQSTWFGLNMTLNLGSPGALASGIFTTSLLLAWSPGGKDTVYPAWVGIKLPGAGSNAKMLSIQGVLKLTVGSIQLMYVPTAGGVNAFLLQMNRIALSFFGLLKLPPGGNTSFFLFGNPTPGATVKSLGWYAAWVKDPPKQSEAPPELAAPQS